MVSTMLWLYELHAICCNMSFASIQDCTPSTATHMSTAPCGSRNEAIRVIVSLPQRLDFRNCNQTNLQIFWVDRKAYKDRAWWWGIMPRTKSTAGSQTYLKESWEINCTNRWVTESHASMFAGNGSWSMRQVTRCSFLAACAAWKLLVHVERYSPESPKISCRLVDLLLKTFLTTKNFSKEMTMITKHLPSCCCSTTHASNLAQCCDLSNANGSSRW